MRKFLPILIAVSALAIYLRSVNLSPYKYYPDSYQNLLVAQNIANFQSVVGTLGDHGTLFPPFFMWSRPVYPLLINLGNLFTKNLAASAQAVSFILGVLTIPLVFILLKTVFADNKKALIGAFLTAVSYNHTIAGGFIMTETTGIFLSVLFLICLFKSSNQSLPGSFWLEVAAGLTLSVAVFARYEYILLIIPALYLVFLLSPKPWIKISLILLVFSVVSVSFLLAFYPIPEAAEKLIGQTTNLVVGSLIAFTVTVLLILFRKRLKRILRRVPAKILALPFFMLAGVSLIMVIFHLPMPFLKGVNDFLRTDFLLVPLFLLGMGLLIRDKKYSYLVGFGLPVIVFLEYFYLKVNPAMQRYNIHLLPFLLLPASFAAVKIWKKATQINSLPGKISIFLVLLLISWLQIKTTATGFKKLNQGIWFTVSYEEVSAGKLKKYLKQTEVIITALPEPYYFFTSNTTLALGQSPPFVNLDDFPDSTGLIIVNDLATRQLFPQFSAFVQNSLQDFQIAQYRTGSVYRYATQIQKEKQPVTVYRLTKKDYQQQISSY